MKETIKQQSLHGMVVSIHPVHVQPTTRFSVWQSVRADLYCEVVPGQYVASTVTELDIRDGGYDLREERSATGVLRLLKHYRQCRAP